MSAWESDMEEETKKINEKLGELEQVLVEDQGFFNIETNKRIEKLEKKFRDIKVSNSAKMINQNRIIADYTLLKERIEKLEKEIVELKEKLEGKKPHETSEMKGTKKANLRMKVNKDSKTESECEHLGIKQCLKCGESMPTVYIDEKSIFLSNYYYPCNIINCPIKEASLSFQGNYYCLKHFVEMVQDDRCEKEDLEWLINDILDWRKAVKREPLMDKFGRLYEIRKKYLEEDDL